MQPIPRGVASSCRNLWSCLGFQEQWHGQWRVISGRRVAGQGIFPMSSQKSGPWLWQWMMYLYNEIYDVLKLEVLSFFFWHDRNFFILSNHFFAESVSEVKKKSGVWMGPLSLWSVVFHPGSKGYHSAMEQPSTRLCPGKSGIGKALPNGTNGMRDFWGAWECNENLRVQSDRPVSLHCYTPFPPEKAEISDWRSASSFMRKNWFGSWI